MDIHPVTADRFGDLAELFESNNTTRGCWCLLAGSGVAPGKAQPARP